jgi:hypothetical protein
LRMFQPFLSTMKSGLAKRFFTKTAWAPLVRLLVESKQKNCSISESRSCSKHGLNVSLCFRVSIPQLVGNHRPKEEIPFSHWFVVVAMRCSVTVSGATMEGCGTGLSLSHAVDELCPPRRLGAPKSHMEVVPHIIARHEVLLPFGTKCFYKPYTKQLECIHPACRHSKEEEHPDKNTCNIRLK